MKPKILKNVNYIGLTIIVIAFTLIYSSYFFIYIPTQKSALTQRAFRILKEYGNNMVGKRAYYETHFKNYGIYYSLRELQKDKKIIRKENLPDSIFNNMNEVFQSIFDYVTTSTLPEDSENTWINMDKQNLPGVYFQNQLNDDNSIQGIKQIYKLNTSLNPGIKKIDELIFKKNIIYKVPANKFMEGLKFDELFENISLFDKSGVYYNSNLDNLPDITNPGPLADSTANTQVGIYKVLKIRGKEKHTMILPVDFDGKRYYIAGTISDLVFKKITRTINSWVLILVAGILLLLFVGMPVLKTMFIGPKERLKLIDVSASGISILFGSALFVLILISIIKHEFVDRHEISERIKLISESLSTNVKTDLESVKNLGWAVSQRNMHQLDLADTVINAFNSTVPFHRNRLLKSPFPLNEIILIDSLGIVSKAYTRTLLSDAMKIDLSERQYFKNVIDTTKAWQISGNLFFYIESITSYNTGYQETAVSFHTNQYGKNKVVAITSEIPSLYNQVLPSDVQFVIIDKTGKVLYHSVKSKNLHENFIEECESNAAVLKAMELKITDKVRIRYNEKKWLARIVPIAETQFFHITLLDVNQTDNKNARIFLITFFLTIGLQVFTIGCIILFIITFPHKTNESNFLRFLKWLSFFPPNYKPYKGMLIIMTLIAAAGVLSFVSRTNVVNVLLLQALSVGFTFFTTYFFLNRNEIRLKDYFRGMYFPENLVFVFLVCLIFFGFAKSDSDGSIVAPLIILLATALVIPLVYKLFSNSKNSNKEPSPQKVKSVYLAVLFLWLAIFSVIPVIHSYFSVKHFEDKLWQQQQFFKIAGENAALLKSGKNHDSPWFNLTRGNGIDGMTVTYSAPLHGLYTDSDYFKVPSTTSEKIYAWLPNPIKNGYSHRELLAAKEQFTEWKLTRDSLYFPVEGKNSGFIIAAGEKIDRAAGYFVVILLVFLLASVCIWKLVKFAATVFLNLSDEKPASPIIPWIEFLKDGANQRILLKSFNGDLFLSETVDTLNGRKIADRKVEPIQAVKLLQPQFDWAPVFSGKAEIIWIYGLHESIPEVENHGFLLNALTTLKHYRDKKIVIDLPFEMELVDEYYDDYIAVDQLTAKEINDIFKLKKRWKLIFEDYISYNGFLVQGEFVENETKLHEKQIKKCLKINPELCFFNIWKNLTSYEKIVLFDLADDGMMNRNNRKIISQLTDKKLIVFNPYPEIFSPAFRDYIYNHITSSEIKSMEGKLGIKGSWKNAKYVILFILVPLAVFIFISQGMTVEKSFGIFAGIVGTITALVKLYESSVLSSK